ncbi:MAG: histidine kinase, partial [Eubacteriales bacterium]|nr:histidine kinase [Eubacteriales bacterium]
MFRAIRNLRLKMTLRQKLFLSHFSIVLITVFLFSSYVMVRTSKTLKVRNDFTAEQSFKQTSDYLSFRIGSLIDICNELTLNLTLNDILNREGETYPRLRQFSDLPRLREVLTGMKHQKDIYCVHLYIDDSLMYSDDGSTIHKMSMAQSAPWWDELMTSRGKILFVNDWAQVSTPTAGEPLISMLRTMYRRSDYIQPAFIVQLDIRQSRLEETLRTADFSEGSVTYLVDAEGRTIASSSWDRQAQLELDGAEQPVVDAPNTAEPVTWGQKRFVSLQTAMSTTGWRMITVIPYNEYYSAVYDMRLHVLLPMLVTLVLGYLLANYTASNHIRRIYKLCNHLTSEQGGLQKIALDPYQDELSVLYRAHNEMVDHTKQLIQENYEISQELKSMEFRAMQSQINPHFLYNTLDTISWLAYNGRTDEVGTVVAALARFYRLSLNGGRDIITVEDELRHVEYYMRIQRVRMENKVLLVNDVPDSLYPFVLPKITLQPIVETTLLHGILEKPDKSGTITLAGESRG